MESSPDRTESPNEEYVQDSQLQEASGEQYYEEGEEHEHHERYAHGEYDEEEEGEEEEEDDDQHQYYEGHHQEGDDEDMGEHEEGDVIMEQHSRKIKRDIQENLNKVRKGKELPRLYTDLFSMIIAGDYAEFLRTNEHDPDIFKQLCEEYNIFGDVKLVYTISKFEEDANITETFHQDFLDLGYLLLEVETDRKVLLDPNLNHLGVGVTMTPENLILVEVFASKILAVTKISDGEDGGIEVRGKMLVDTMGLFAVRMQSLEAKKALIVGPPNIEFDRNTKDFIVYLDVEETVGSSNKVLEFYVRKKPETIEYKKPSNEKINLNHLDLAHRCPCITFPDPRYLAEDEEDRERKQQEALEKMRMEEEKRLRKEEERRERKESRKMLRQEIDDRRARGEEIESLASSTQRSDRSFASKGSFAARTFERAGLIGDTENKSIGSPERSAADEKSDIGSLRKGEDVGEDRIMEGDGSGYEEIVGSSKAPGISNKEINYELEMAIDEAQKQLKKEEDRNFFLQNLISQLKEKNDLHLEKQNEIPMTEPKYLNTLAHVHQIRLDLKQTQDRYNEMARELQMKLDEKQAKCYEIRKAFMDLKREVCKKAAYSRTDKPISEMLVERWEEDENEKSKELQLLRLENLRLRNHLAKNQKVLKKKEELAEGLHLIDYEQLKIENQTLNEKIEERNEDLHKLKKKNTNTVQILTHFKEKLQFVIQENEKLKKIGEEKEDELKKLRMGLNESKENRQKIKEENQKLKQQTGILNSKHLSKDFEDLKVKLRKERNDLKYLQEKYKYMEVLVKEYSRRVSKMKPGTR